MGDADDRRIVEGLAATAVAAAEMGESDDAICAQLAAWLTTLRVDDPVAVVRAAAQAVGGMPQPISESAAETERARPIREMLGVQSADEQLVAALRARECLERLANDLG